MIYSYYCWPQASQLIEKNVLLIEQSTQTDEELIYNYAWEKFYSYFYTHQQQQQQQQQQENNNNTQEVVIVENELVPEGACSSNNELLDFESIKKCAEQSLSTSGFVFDKNSGYYYDQSSGYYYDQVRL